MTDEREVAVLLVRNAQRVARQVAAPIATAYGRGYVDFFDSALHRASIRKGTRDAQPTPGFDVPLWLHLRAGDYVQFREVGSDRVVLAPLDRNASVDQFANPLSAAGQIIIAGPDGTPTVIEPPADPTLDYALEWDGATQLPVWVEV